MTDSGQNANPAPDSTESSGQMLDVSRNDFNIQELEKTKKLHELEVRKLEIEAVREHNRSMHEFSLKSLDFQEKFSEKTFNEERAKLKYGFAAVIFILVLIGLLCWLFLAYGQNQLIEKIFTLAIGAIGGAGGMYGLSAKKQSASNNKDQSENQIPQ